MIRKAAELLEEQVNEKLDTFLRLLEPVLIGILAFVVSGVMIAIFLPISNAINSMYRNFYNFAACPLWG